MLDVPEDIDPAYEALDEYDLAIVFVLEVFAAETIPTLNTKIKLKNKIKVIVIFPLILYPPINLTINISTLKVVLFKNM